MQKYITKPYLVDSFKFDFRIYVLLVGINPLRIYVHKEGLSRLATVPFEKPNEENMKNLNMHLTNYAINKDHEDFIVNEHPKFDSGSKRSMASVMKIILEQFGEEATTDLEMQIYDIIIKSITAVQPQVSHLLKLC